jgi:membrane protease YdiL (CAAX protease family)
MSEPQKSNPIYAILRTFFFSAGSTRLRAGWRLGIHTILLILIIIPIGIIIFIPIGELNISFDSSVVFLAGVLTQLLAITIATFLVRRFLDKQSIISLGLKPGTQALMDVITGIVITFFQMGLIYIIEISMGWTKFTGFASDELPITEIASGVGVWVIAFILVGWQEELLSRGYHLQTIASGSNLFWGVLISSSIFGFLHMSNNGASWVSTFGIFLAGLFLALPYILTKQLWVSIGLHIGWNFFEGVVFGFPVSGIETFRLLRHTVNGPEIWTGGVFGPEAGLIVIPALLLGSLFVFAYTRSGVRKEHLT